MKTIFLSFLVLLSFSLQAKTRKYVINKPAQFYQHDMFGIEKGVFKNETQTISIACTTNMFGSDEMTFTVSSEKKKIYKETFDRDIKSAEKCADKLVDMINLLEDGETLEITSNMTGFTYKSIAAESFDLSELSRKIQLLIEENSSQLTSEDKKVLLEDLERLLK